MRVADNMLRPFWRSVFRNSLLLNLVLFSVFAALRIYGLFGPVPAPFPLMASSLLMCLGPVVFLSRTGRDAIGLKTGWDLGGLFFGTLLGLVTGVLTFAAAFPFLVITFLPVILAISVGPPLALDFIGFTALLAVSTAVGQELFFRGMVYASLRQVSGSRLAAGLGNALAFAAIHVPNHGFLRHDPSWFPLTIIWVVIMFGLSFLFTWCRERTGSIWPAVLSHTTYNFTMSFLILLLGFGSPGP